MPITVYTKPNVRHEALLYPYRRCKRLRSDCVAVQPL